MKKRSDAGTQGTQISRRSVIKGIGGTILAGSAVVAGCKDEGPSTMQMDAAPMTGKAQLRILQWSHWVPTHNMWIDELATKWGAENKVEVTVTHVPLAELGPKVLTDLMQGAKSFDLFMTLGAFAHLEPYCKDLKELNQEAAKAARHPDRVV